jgi:hypothetical protein
MEYLFLLDDIILRELGLIINMQLLWINHEGEIIEVRKQTNIRQSKQSIKRIIRYKFEHSS